LEKEGVYSEISQTKNSEVKPQKGHNINLSINKQVNNYRNDEKINNSCSFRGKDDKGVIIAYCGKPLFDKKKQLCRSHNKQV
jgi:hypothetical protein